MTYPDFIKCPKCGSEWSTRMEIIKNGICPHCKHPLKKKAVKAMKTSNAK